MIEGSKRLIIGGEVFAADEIVATEPPKVSIGGHNDYVLFFVDEGIASGILGEKNFAQAKGQNEDLVDHIPQVMVEMQACAKRLKSRHIRGTITNGRAWIFLLLELNDNFVGGRYWASQRYEIKTNYTDYDTQTLSLSIA
ncbi:uncharacterized protein B0H18DRAFT_1117274 [Fomitopsis serialis]|uniref:uncharacterized protein n=1 Tax=Fomitopsis serialis TaxID=139415 RepID=UPI0020085D11|nr:uncharacterized protein B0H18DRAFT_1117274 [Neoantrodia serialis]KAH9929721.1 hypothetical protein B0H18DRAFT_1117274 [Neoantrodia serialis]